MLIPESVPGIKWIVVLWAAVAVAWVILEGNLGWTVLFGILTAFMAVGMIVKRTLAGRNLSLRMWLTVTAFIGLLFGLGSAILTLLFMAVKTGLHAHGPEFTSFELNWVLQRAPIWAAAGLIGGLGLGLLLKAVSKP